MAGGDPLRGHISEALDESDRQHLVERFVDSVTFTVGETPDPAHFHVLVDGGPLPEHKTVPVDIKRPGRFLRLVIAGR